MEERPSSNTLSEKADDFPDYEIKNIIWTTCKDFTVELGKRQIVEYIQTWEVHPSWLYSLEFLQECELESRRQYHYRVRWSIPTQHTPIPNTACVYFRIEIPIIKPQTVPVEVYFTIESNRLVHRPGKTRVREKWLKDVIESKALLQNRTQ